MIGDWLEQAAPDIQARMAQYEESQIEFAILSLVKDPVIDLLSVLAENVRGIIATQSRLDEIKPDWRSFTTDATNERDQRTMENVLTGPDTGLLLTDEQIFLASTEKDVAIRLQTCQPTEALTIRKELIETQQGLKLALQDEIQSRHMEDEKAGTRTHDFGAKMQRFARKVRAKEVC